MITTSYSLTATERVLPKLALDFTTATLDSRVTFTRTTGASNPATFINSSGYITNATNNQARFDYNPVTLACRGLLIEESRVNSFLQSEDASNSFWQLVNTNISVSSNAVTSPANTLTGDTLVATAVSGQHFLQTATIANTASVVYTISVFAKAAGYNFLRLGSANANSSARACFNLSNGTFIETPAGAARMESYGNGWYRCIVTYTATATTAASLFLSVNNASSLSTLSFLGDGVSGVTVWGAQHEPGAFPTSYIPTTTTALTRNADVATMTGTNFSDWFNASEGAAVVQVLPSTISGTRPAIEFDDNTANQAITLQGVAADPQLFVVNGGAAQATLDAGTITANAVYKLGGAWKSSSFAASVNGGGSVSQLSGTYPTVTQARLGSDGTNYLNGCLQNLRYWPQRITNAETQAFSK